MNRRRALCSMWLAATLAIVALGIFPNSALAGGDRPACMLPGLDFVWSFVDWLFPSQNTHDDGNGSGNGNSEEEDEGEKMFDEYFGPF